MKYLSSWLEAGGGSLQYIAAVSLQRTRGLIVAEFSLRKLMPQVPPCDSCAQMDLTHHLHHWQHFVPICRGVGRQCGTLSWPCGVGQGDTVLCPRLAVQGFAVSLLCMALGACWQLTGARINSGEQWWRGANHHQLRG